eukprot:m.360937 g.360937  ORF g.360937 m.360937 type:complete len:373 (-) comp19237_c0_seq1:198-1316(-)
MSRVLTFEGTSYFRQRIVLATLAGRKCRFVNIRRHDDNPGLQDYERKFLMLIEMITDGTRTTIDETGTNVTFSPGIITNGRHLKFDCGTTRGIGYFLEHLLYLAPFGKVPLHITFKGITNDNNDPSLDIVRTLYFPLLERFGIVDGIEIRVARRGCRLEGRDGETDRERSGGGEATFQCPIVKKLNPVRVDEPGRIKRIRGMVYTTKVPPRTGQRVLEAARGPLNSFIPDVFIYTDHCTKGEGGKAPGYGISLVAESDTKALMSAEVCATAGQVPEELGDLAGRLLLEEIVKGGCIDTQSQHLAFALMVLVTQDVSKVLVGQLSDYSIAMMQDIKTIMGTEFKIERTAGTPTTQTMVSCLGIGHQNTDKKLL